VHQKGSFCCGCEAKRNWRWLGRDEGMGMGIGESAVLRCASARRVVASISTMTRSFNARNARLSSQPVRHALADHVIGVDTDDHVQLTGWLAVDALAVPTAPSNDVEAVGNVRHPVCSVRIAIESSISQAWPAGCTQRLISERAVACHCRLAAAACHCRSMFASVAVGLAVAVRPCSRRQRAGGDAKGC
jgi:hypothetical protein